MTRDETAVSLRIPVALVEKMDEIAGKMYLTRDNVIVDACAYYCQFHDMNSERFPETMRNVFFDLARHDAEFRRILRELFREPPLENPDK